MKNEATLLQKYDVPVPRYTSYPTVPDWDLDSFQKDTYQSLVKQSFARYGEDGLSLYIHLPYCESLCTYCGCNTRISVNHGVEEPYIKALLKEWYLYLKLFKNRPTIKEIHLGGGTPTFFSPKHLKELIVGLLEYADLHQGFEFSFEGHPANTTYEHLKVLSEVGFSRISFGIQDFDPVVQKAINRFQSFEEVERVTRCARELGYQSVNYDLIYGLPFQTLDSLHNTISYVSELMPDRIAYYSYAHVPWKRPGQRAYSEKDLPSLEQKRKLNQVGQQRLMELGYELVGMDHFALPDDQLITAMHRGDLHRNFMGYTVDPGKLLIGLGVSSISDIHLAYGQNVKTVEGYISKVEKGQLPVFKGHKMTEDDISVKAKVLEVACKKSFDDRRLPEGSSQTVYELLKDGLLTKKGGQYIVTSLGNQFLRNICSLFDSNFQKVRKEKTFSQAV